LSQEGVGWRRGIEFTILDDPAVGFSGCADLIQALMRVHHHRLLDADLYEGLRVDLSNELRWSKAAI
jgi:hypothetical protein